MKNEAAGAQQDVSISSILGVCHVRANSEPAGRAEGLKAGEAAYMKMGVSQEEHNRLVRRDIWAITRHGRNWNHLTEEEQEAILRDADAEGYPALKADPGVVIK